MSANAPAPPLSAPRWSVERRLNFIASRLAWERRVNRADLVERFGVSPNQASADLRRFSEQEPRAMAYDSRAKTYRAQADWPRPDAGDTSLLLRDLRLIAEGVMSPEDGVLAHVPSTALAEPPLRAVPGAVLAAVVAAIRDRRALSAVYQSFSTPEPRVRRLEPHALVFDGFRWHARARDADEGRFKDFVLGRMAQTVDAGPTGSDGADDEDWQTFVRLEIAPHPGLTPAQRAAVEADYGMSDGRLVLTPRLSVAYYVKRRLGLTPGHEARPPHDQHVVLMTETTRHLSGAKR